MCATHDGVVFLDLFKDRYLGLNRHHATALAAAVRGWGDAFHIAETAKSSDGVDPLDVATWLENQGLLTRDPSKGRPVESLKLTSKATLVALGTDTESSTPLGAADVLNFLSACTSAALTLQVLGLRRAVQGVRVRKKLRAPLAHLDQSRATELVLLFRRLRVYLFTSKDRCLFHALALVNFLAKYDIFPFWVLGVKTAPFAAHSWVQYDDLVFDSTPEDVCFYRPILAV